MVVVMEGCWWRWRWWWWWRDSGDEFGLQISHDGRLRHASVEQWCYKIQCSWWFPFIHRPRSPSIARSNLSPFSLSSCLCFSLFFIWAVRFRRPLLSVRFFDWRCVLEAEVGTMRSTEQMRFEIERSVKAFVNIKSFSFWVQSLCLWSFFLSQNIVFRLFSSVVSDDTVSDDEEPRFDGFGH